MALADRELKRLHKPRNSLATQTLHQTQIALKKVELRLYRWRGGQIANFLHIPKTGGSAVKNALRGIPKTPRCRIHLRGHSCRLTDIPAGDKFFFFIRDPAERFVSAFNHKKAGRGQWQHHRIAAETAALKRFDTANHLAKTLSSSNGELRQAAKSAMLSIEHVNTFYADWFISQEYFLSRRQDCLYVGFQESLSEDFEQLKALLALPRTLTLPALTSRKANRNPEQFSKALSSRARANLADWYAQDYAFFEFFQAQAAEINPRGHRLRPIAMAQQTAVGR